jgi:hypothetical protein
VILNTLLLAVALVGAMLVVMLGGPDLIGMFGGLG